MANSRVKSKKKKKKKKQTLNLLSGNSFALQVPEQREGLGISMIAVIIFFLGLSVLSFVAIVLK